MEKGTYTGAEPARVRGHYEVGVDFYRPWLDASLTYSCALWDGEDDTLDDAQARKLDYLLTQARTPRGGRLLDIGCGWGSMMRRAVDRHGADHAVGVTLSEDQAATIASAHDPRIEVRVVNWADFDPGEPFDAIVSAGAFEHFARWGQRRKEKVGAYRAYFAFCHAALRPGAFMSLQTIARGHGGLGESALEDVETMRTMFPDSLSPRLAEIAHACEGTFEMVSLRADPHHYARTCRVWLDNLRRERDACVAAAGEETTALYERYLEACIRQFDQRQATLLRIGFERL